MTQVELEKCYTFFLRWGIIWWVFQKSQGESKPGCLSRPHVVLFHTQLLESLFTHLKKGCNIHLKCNRTFQIKIKWYLPSKYYSLGEKKGQLVFLYTFKQMISLLVVFIPLLYWDILDKLKNACIMVYGVIIFVHIYKIITAIKLINMSVT